MDNVSSLLPEITNEDIDWVRDFLRLDDLDEPRRLFLTARSTLDVFACPGSGKTTLAVAKLAILARKWTHRTKGICVLSHTNVAQEEIQRRLGGTVIGQRLLRYPHFIDTIHGFVNRFLALPWLSSNGHPPLTIDDNLTTAYRRSTLTESNYWMIQNFLHKKQYGFDRLRICARDLSFDLGGKAFPAGPNTKSFRLAKKAVETAAQAGYFCYDEMFVWARALLEDFPFAASWLRRRFPFVIVDEMQDTSTAQGAILHAVFPRSSHDIVVQRVGDPNQAIFDSDTKADENDPFPDSDSARCLEIPNSYRFGPEIAAIASPFALKKVGTNGLCGVGPKAIADAPKVCPHAIFIFPDNSTAGVLDAYGMHVLTVFNDFTLARGMVTAVGAVHQDASDVAPAHAQYPKTVPHYWCGYSAEISQKDPHPKTLAQYFRAAQATVRDGGDLSAGVEKIAHGLVRLVCQLGDASQFRRKARSHREMTGILATDAEALTKYRRLIKEILIDRVQLTEENWSAIQDIILDIAAALCGRTVNQSNAVGYLAWPKECLPLVACSPASLDHAGPNIYRVIDGGRRLDIRLGSIHSIKGQTHLATMVLDTYWFAHSSHRILPWLLGTKVNECGAGIQDCKRLLQTYVAMTRPSHLICLAARRSTFGDDQTLSHHVATLEANGWRVAELIDGNTIWYGQPSP